MLITNISFSHFQTVISRCGSGFTIFLDLLGFFFLLKFFINSLKTPSISLFEGLKSMCLDHFLTANADCKLINKTKAV